HHCGNAALPILPSAARDTHRMGGLLLGVACFGAHISDHRWIYPFHVSSCRLDCFRRPPVCGICAGLVIENLNWIRLTNRNNQLEPQYGARTIGAESRPDGPATEGGSNEERNEDRNHMLAH